MTKSVNRLPILLEFKNIRLQSELQWNLQGISDVLVLSNHFVTFVISQLSRMLPLKMFITWKFQILFNQLVAGFLPEKKLLGKVLRELILHVEDGAL